MSQLIELAAVVGNYFSWQLVLLPVFTAILAFALLIYHGLSYQFWKQIFLTAVRYLNFSVSTSFSLEEQN